MLFFVFSLLVSIALGTIEKPKYGLQAKRLFDSHAYIQKAKAQDFWALIPYYVPQRDARSCSLASITMVLNAAQARKALRAKDKLALQNDVLTQVNDPAWNHFLISGGPSTGLDDLARILTRALNLRGFNKARVEILRLESNSAKEVSKLQKALQENEASMTDFMIANFLQSEFTGDPDGAIGHVAPIAAFDASKDQVLVLDPDRDYYEPYWVSVQVLARGMLTKDSGFGKTRGLLWARGLE